MGKEGRQAAEEGGQAMIYRRGKNGIYSYRFRFAGRMIHESARTKSKTLAREAERQRRRELELRVNNIVKRGLPPTFEVAPKRWMAGREHAVAENTQSVARLALKHLLPAFGAKLLCDIVPRDIEDYQRNRLRAGVQGRTANIETSILRQILKAHDMWVPFTGKVKMLRERHDIGKALTPEQERALLQAMAGIDSACHTASVLALNTTLRRTEIRLLRWEQIDLGKRVLVVGHSKTDAGEGRPIPLNSTAFEALVRWAGRYPDTRPEHYVFPWCESRQIDPTRPTKGWRTAWRHALKQAGFHCRFHDLRHTCITKLSEGQASDMTLMAIAGHVSKKMLERYSHIRMQAKRTAVDAIVQRSERAVFEGAVHQNVHQLREGVSGASAKPLN
jgi:integrase